MEKSFKMIKVFNDNGKFIGIIGVYSFADLERLTTAYSRYEFAN